MSFVSDLEDAIVDRLKSELAIDNIDGARGAWDEIMGGLFALPGVRVVYEGSEFEVNNRIEREVASFTVLFACRDMRGAGRDDAYSLLEDGRIALRGFRPNLENVSDLIPTKTTFVAGTPDHVVYALQVQTKILRRF